MPCGTTDLVGFAPSFLCRDQMLGHSFCAVECHTKHIITLHIKISLYFCTTLYLDKALNHCVISGSIFSLHCRKHLFRSIIRTTCICSTQSSAITGKVHAHRLWLLSPSLSLFPSLSLSLSPLHPSTSHLQISTSLGELASRESLTGCEP